MLQQPINAIFNETPPAQEPWQEAVLNECMRIEGCYKEADPAGSVKCLIDWHVKNATPPAQEDEPRYLLNGTRFKMSFNDSGRVSCFAHYRPELDGQWVALVNAENDKHMTHARPDNSKLRQVAEILCGYIENGAINKKQLAELGQKLSDALEGES